MSASVAKRRLASDMALFFCLPIFLSNSMIEKKILKLTKKWETRIWQAKNLSPRNRRATFRDGTRFKAFAMDPYEVGDELSELECRDQSGRNTIVVVGRLAAHGTLI
jgi:hypothetical protein